MGGKLILLQITLNGYLADCHFVDGQALAATDGEFDDNNVWQPENCSGTHNTAAVISSYPAVLLALQQLVEAMLVTQMVEEHISIPNLLLEPVQSRLYLRIQSQELLILKPMAADMALALVTTSE